MKRTRWFAVLIFLGACWILWGRVEAPARYVAFSMKQAQQRFTTRAALTDVRELGGITQLIGYVSDTAAGDIIFVGLAEPEAKKLSLDDFVVALRAVLSGRPPLVSIDPPQPGNDPKMQSVRFEGGIANTRLGKEMLEADVALKRLALGEFRADVWGVHSYLAMSVDSVRRNRELPEVTSKFWLKRGEVDISGGPRDGVMVIHRLRVYVETEVVSDDKSARDEIGDAFSAQIAARFGDLSLQYAPLSRVKPILQMVALAEGLRNAGFEKHLQYWNESHAVEKVPTPTTFALAERAEEIGKSGQVIRLSGGIELNPLLIRLNAGDASALREVVLKSRPSPNSLSWNPPLSGWDLTGEGNYLPSTGGGSTATDGGFSIQRRIDLVTRPDMVRPATPTIQPPRTPSSTSIRQPPTELRLPSAAGPALAPQTTVPTARIQAAPITQFRDYKTYTPPSYARGVGGVMLSGTAAVEGAERPQVDLSRGGFSLVVEGRNASLSPETFRRFVTALWAVYFSDHDPGISIDPIEPNGEKHLVRYIGNVLNTDLGRVMREADYLMKKWAVGTERANIPGFMNPDDFIAKIGLNASAHSRFWFVPEDMTFKRAGDMLLFSGGRMTVKTEYLSQGLSAHAEPANERFAELFTNQYDRIAENYSVYRELFEYAKLVSLAKYLKSSGVPLQWFLMANKDLVLTEDSPGTVDALAQGSKYYRNLTMTGGVNLKTEGRYVYDATAVNAIERAIAGPAASGSGRSTMASAPKVSPAMSEPFSFDLGKTGYSVIPQHSLTAGKDYWGNRYQTDIALRNSGKTGLELVRYFDARRPGQTEFGSGWRLLVPYRVKAFNEEKRDFLNARVPVRMTVENLLSGREEVLAFSTDRYSIAGYVPDKLASSQVVGLFLMSNATYRLADKFGNEFWFDQGGTMTDMIFADQDRIHYQYLARATNDFDRPPYAMRPANTETVEYRGESLPKQIVIRDDVHAVEETLAFDLTQEVASYFPLEETKSRYRRLRWTPGSAYRLEDRQGNVVAFRKDGGFEAMAPRLESELVKSVTMGKHKVEMSYSIDPEGRVVIGKAVLAVDGESSPRMAVRYGYNADGTLAAVERIDAKNSIAMARRVKAGRQ